MDYIDWSPFFHAWGNARALSRHSRGHRGGCQGEGTFRRCAGPLEKHDRRRKADGAGGVWILLLASRGDDILIYKDDARSEVLKTLPTLRQQILKPSGQHHHALADYVAPEDSGLKDYVGFFAVTTGHGCDEWAATFEADHDDYGSIMTKALADRLAEAFAECLHQTARKEWHGRDESLNNEDLIRERYRGIRPAPGYSACPDHTQKPMIWDLLDVEAQTGIRLTESCAMWPAASVSGVYFSHPEAKYFFCGKTGQRSGGGLRPAQRSDSGIGPSMAGSVAQRIVKEGLAADPHPSSALPSREIRA